MNINKDKLLSNFKNIKNLANIEILSCTKKLFCKNGIIKNIAFYLLMIIILFHIIAIFIFCTKQKDSLYKIIKDIIFAIKNFKLIDIKRNKFGKKPNNKMTKKNTISTNNINKNNNINNKISRLDNINNKIIKEDKKIYPKKKGQKGKAIKGKGKNKFNKNIGKEENKPIHININNELINNRIFNNRIFNNNDNDNSNNILTINKNKNIKNNKNKKRNTIIENTSIVNKEKIIEKVLKILE
jgi:hypothetical protein